MKHLEELRKTLDQSDITGKLIQNKINKVIQDLVDRNNPLRQNLRRVPGSGEGAFINKRTALPVAQTVADTTQFNRSKSTYGTRDEFAFKTVGVGGEVTRRAQAVGRSYNDLLAAEIGAATDAVKLKEGDLLINGDLVGDATEFNGLEKLVPAGQIISVDANGGPLTLDILDQAVDAVFGNPNMMIASKRSRRQVNGLLQAQQRFTERTEVKGGFRVLSYNEIPIFDSQHQSDAETKGTATDASSIYIFDSDKVYVEVLTELQKMDLARTSSQLISFDIFEDVVLVVANTKYIVRIDGITPA